VTEPRFPKIFAKDLSNVVALVAWATEMQRTGSYSDRHPNLGKMRKCHQCGTRRREFGSKCCNTKYATTRRAWTPEEGFHMEECPERVTSAIVSKSFLKRFLHKKHGQSRQFKIRQLIYRFQHDQSLVEAAAKEMHVPVPEPAHVPAFGEKFWLWKNEMCDRIVRNRQKESRRLNHAKN
jgi:hypothetical protein